MSEPERTVVHVWRHGEVFNPDKILYGRLPGFGLSDAGRAMAQAGAEYLAPRDLAALYTSPLQRARETVAALEQRTGLTAEVDPRLIESRNEFQGTVVDIGPALLLHPEIWRHLWNPFRPSWGEPYREVAARMLAAVAAARDAHPGREVAMVSHQLPIETLRRRVQGDRLWHRPDRRQCALASVTSLVFRGRAVERVDYAEPAGSSPTAAGNVGA